MLSATPPTFTELKTFENTSTHSRETQPAMDSYYFPYSSSTSSTRGVRSRRAVREAGGEKPVAGVTLTPLPLLAVEVLFGFSAGGEVVVEDALVARLLLFLPPSLLALAFFFFAFLS